MNDTGRKFSNDRDWRGFISAVQDSVMYPCSVAYPKVISALRSDGAWFTDVAAQTPRWPAAVDGLVCDADHSRV